MGKFAKWPKKHKWGKMKRDKWGSCNTNDTQYEMAKWPNEKGQMGKGPNETK